jgi:hypothetical protein
MNPARRGAPPFGSEERRAARRYELPLPVIVRAISHQQSKHCDGKIRDMSTRGIYFVTEREYIAGLELEFTLALPEEITEGIRVSLRGHARVLRTEERREDGTARTGVAAVIEGIEFIRAEVTSP